MKNMKIKTYSVTKHSSIEKKNTNEMSVQQSQESKPVSNNTSCEINKLIKNPSLNISSKMDSKGNRLININLFDKQIKNNFVEIEGKNNNLHNSSNFSQTASKLNNSDMQRASVKYNSNNLTNNQMRNSSNINIKLNFNSEVINNNIQISKAESLGGIKASTKDYSSPNKIKEKTANPEIKKKPSKEHLKTLSIHNEMNVDKDKLIEMLKSEIQEQKKIIKKLTEENLVLKNRGRNDLQATDSKEENVLGTSSENFNKNASYLKKDENKTNHSIEKEKADKIKFSSFKMESINLKDNSIDPKSIVFKPNLQSQTANFRKSNQNSLFDINLSQSSNKIYCPKESKSIEEILKTTAKLMETNTISSYETKTKSNSSFLNGDMKEAFRNLKNRTQKLLEKYSEKLMKINGKI